MLNKPRIVDRFGTEEDFIAAARKAIGSLDYTKQKLPSGEYEFSIPAYGSSIIQSAPRRSYNPFRSENVELYEAPAAALLAFLVKSFALVNVYDIGASDGKHALFIASMDDFEGGVYAFEMQPSRFADMTALQKKMGVTRLHPQLTGLSNRHEGKRIVWYNASKLFESQADASGFHQAWWRRLKFWLRGETHRLRVHEVSIELTSVDHFAATHDAAPDVLKIDVDGYEPLVLEGASRSIETSPPFILLELHRSELMSRFGVEKHQVAERLLDLGYSALWMIDHHAKDTQLVRLERGEPTLRTAQTQMILFY